MSSRQSLLHRLIIDATFIFYYSQKFHQLVKKVVEQTVSLYFLIFNRFLRHWPTES